MPPLLSFPGVQNDDQRKCAVCAQSWERLPLKSKRLYEYQNTWGRDEGRGMERNSEDSEGVKESKKARERE